MKNLLSGGLETRRRKFRIPQGLENVRENSVVPPGLESLVPLFPALKRWAKLGRPYGAEISKSLRYRYNDTLIRSLVERYPDTEFLLISSFH